MTIQDTNKCGHCEERISLDYEYCPHCGEEQEIEYPIRFDMYASGNGTTSELIEIAGLPHTDEIADALYYYPGEVTLHAELSESLDVTVNSIEYSGRVFTPEEHDE